MFSRQKNTREISLIQTGEKYRNIAVMVKNIESGKFEANDDLKVEILDNLDNGNYVKTFELLQEHVDLFSSSHKRTLFRLRYDFIIGKTGFEFNDRLRLFTQSIFKEEKLFG